MSQTDSEGDINPLEPLGPVEERVRQFLIRRARETSPDQPFTAVITYGDLCKALDPDEHYWVAPRYRGIGQVLGRVSRWEHAPGRPLLSALVVQAQAMRAGKGFAQLARDLGEHVELGQETAYWRNQVEEVVCYWSGRESSLDESSNAAKARALALLAKISGELDEVRRLLA
jgi:hypothetical protein